MNHSLLGSKMASENFNTAKPSQKVPHVQQSKNSACSVIAVLNRDLNFKIKCPVKLNLWSRSLFIYWHVNTVSPEDSNFFTKIYLRYGIGLVNFPIGNMLSVPCAVLLIDVNKITNSRGIVSGALLGQPWLPGYCCPEGVCSSDCEPTVEQIEPV